MWFFTLRQLTVAASRSRRLVPLLRAVLVQVAAPTPHAAGRLFAVGPNVAKLLAVKTLGERGLGFIRLYLHGDMAEAGQLEDCGDFSVLGRVTRNRGRFTILDASGDRRVDVICLTLMTSNPRSSSPSEMSWAGVLLGRWRNTALIGFSDFGKKVK
jgi:hypothetical protein